MPLKVLSYPSTDTTKTNPKLKSASVLISVALSAVLILYHTPSAFLFPLTAIYFAAEAFTSARVLRNY